MQIGLSRRKRKRLSSVAEWFPFVEDVPVSVRLQMSGGTGFGTAPMVASFILAQLAPRKTALSHRVLRSDCFGFAPDLLESTQRFAIHLFCPCLLFSHPIPLFPQPHFAAENHLGSTLTIRFVSRREQRLKSVYFSTLPQEVIHFNEFSAAPRSHPRMAHKTFGTTDLTSTYSVCTRRVFGGIEPRPSGLESNALTTRLPTGPNVKLVCINLALQSNARVISDEPRSFEHRSSDENDAS
ncbi:hypothetical protein TNCV_1366292 [Trichonephila clavipes]|nr:hypothetical protein TNCV_1366292 [Trichonephila clavipes]